MPLLYRVATKASALKKKERKKERLNSCDLKALFALQIARGGQNHAKRLKFITPCNLEGKSASKLQGVTSFSGAKKPPNYYLIKSSSSLSTLSLKVLLKAIGL
jgi:hypothetical protein